jgi:hypothetical protein
MYGFFRGSVVVRSRCACEVTIARDVLSRVNSSTHQALFSATQHAFLTMHSPAAYDFANRSPACHLGGDHDGFPNPPKHSMHSIHPDIKATSAKSPSHSRGSSLYTPCSNSLTKRPGGTAKRFAAIALLALTFAIPLPALSTQAAPHGGATEGSGISRADTHFRVGIRIVSSCQVFVTAQGEVRSTCSSSWTPPPHIVAITSIQNESQSGMRREYAVTF